MKCCTVSSQSLKAVVLNWGQFCLQGTSVCPETLLIITSQGEGAMMLASSDWRSGIPPRIL